MPIVDFDSLPNDARVWVYGSTRELTQDAERAIVRREDACKTKTLLEANDPVLHAQRHRARCEGKAENRDSDKNQPGVIRRLVFVEPRRLDENIQEENRLHQEMMPRVVATMVLESLAHVVAVWA